MSLIDGLIDELNKSADEWNESNMFELARMCRNAAYTISELQNDADLLRAMLSQKRTEKQCYVAENAKLRESLERATGIIADLCGECPVSRYEWLSSDGCAEKCGTVTVEECWIAYLTGKRWDESGAEVDR